MKTKKCLIYFALSFAFFIFTSNQIFAQTQKLIVSNLKGGDYFDCGCSLQTLKEAKNPRSMKIVFWSETPETAILNVNGNDTKFKLLKRANALRK